MNYIFKIEHFKEDKLLLNILSSIRDYYRDNNIQIKKISNLPNNVYYISNGYLNGMPDKEGNYPLQLLILNKLVNQNVSVLLKIKSKKKQKYYLHKVTNARNVGFIRYRID